MLFPSLVQPIQAKVAKDFVVKYHYSKTASPGLARYGWFTLQRGMLVGVSIFDTGNHDMRKGVFGPEYYSHVVHHHRLAVHPDVPHGMTSLFHAETLRQLHKDRPEIWAVVSYADSDQGHLGTIYQATNAIYTGRVTRGNLYYKNPETNSIVTMQSLKKYKGVALTWSERRKLAENLNYVECRSQGKHRYIYLLGSSNEKRKYPELLWDELPYPKTTLMTRLNVA